MDAFTELLDWLRGRGLEIDMLVNNAGFGSMGDFQKQDLARQLNMIDATDAQVSE